MPCFLLVRHAEAPWSPDEMRPLSPAGRAAAARLAERLADPDIEAIYSSPYRRAIETVAPLADRLGLPVEAIHDLRERALGAPPQRGFAFEQAVAATFDDFAFAHPGGEPNRAAQRRAVSALETLAARHPSRPVVLSTHGTLLTLLLNHFDRSVGMDLWRSLTFPDAYRLEIPASGDASFVRVAEPTARR